MEQGDDGRHFHIPLSEHDLTREAFIEPAATIAPRDVPRACVVTFFGDVVDRLVERRGARVLAENRWEDGPHPLLEIEHDGERLAVLRCGVGAPLAGGLLEETIAMGCRGRTPRADRLLRRRPRRRRVGPPLLAGPRRRP